MVRRFVLCANDKRNVYLAKSLAEQGHEVALWRTAAALGGIPTVADDALSGAQCIMVLSPAESQDTIGAALDLLPRGSIVFGGRIGAVNKDYAACRGVRYVNLLEYEPMTLLNAIPTAEGALCLALERTPCTVFGASVLVLGFGRVGKATARLFQAAGAQVEVLARSPEARAMAQLFGLRASGFFRLLEALPGAQIVMDTIPELILEKEELSLLSPDSLVIDLASAPGGVDFEAAKALGIQALQALALPGKYAPQSAAKYMQEGILTLLQRMEGDIT